MKPSFVQRPHLAFSLAILTVLCLGGLLRVPAATITWTGAGGDDSWHNRTNWSTLTVPGGNDDAVINEPALTVIHTNGGTFVRSLQCATAFSILGGSLTVTDGASQVAGVFAMGMNTALIASGPTAICTISNATVVDSANFAAVSGATLMVGGLTAYQKPSCSDVYWQAIGPGSRLTFPSLLNLAGNPSCGWLRLRATGGGKLEFGALTNLMDSYIETLADGTGSLVDFSSLVSGQQFNAYATTDARNGAEVRLTQLAVTARNSFFLRSGSIMTFPAVTNADNGSFYALDGSVIELPLVTNYTKPHCADVFLSAYGAGSRVVFPALVNLSGSASCGWLRLRAQQGGTLELGAVTNISDSYIETLAEDANSLVDLSGVLRMNQFNASGAWEVRNGGEVRLTHLLSSARNHFTVTASGLMPFPTLTNADSSGFTAQGGAVVQLSLITNYNKPNCADAYFVATGAGSRLQFPALVNLSGSPTCGWLRLRAQAGGVLDLSSVTNIADGYVDTLAENTNSVVDFSRLLRTAQINAYAVTEAGAGGEVRLPKLGESGRHGFTLRSTGVMSLPALTNADNASFTAREGAVWEIPLVMHYAKSACPDVYFLATGAGSRLKFPALSSLAGNNTCGWLGLHAENGGTLEIPGVTTIPNGYVSLYADGPGSLLSLTSLTSYIGVNAYAAIEARNGALIQLPDVTSLNRILNLTVRNGGSITLTQLINLTASSVLADNAIIDLNSVLYGGGTSLQEINGGDILINPQVVPLTVTWTGAGGDHSWHNGSNWSTGVVPGPFNDVQISLAGASVQFNSNAPPIRSLTASQPLTVSGGALIVSNSFTINNSTFTLSGGTLNFTNTAILNNSTAALLSGSIVGQLRLINGSIAFGANSTVTGTLAVRGNVSSTGNVPAGFTVRVEGSIVNGWSFLTLPNGGTNFGTIVLETISNDGFDRGSYMIISTGALVNAASGLIQANLGTGDPRTITGDVENWGTILVQSNITLQLQGNGHQFAQRSGLVQGDGELLSQGGSFVFTGGLLAGVVRAHDAFVSVAETVTSTSTLRAVGGNSVLGGNLAPNVTLWIEGSIPYGYAQLTVTNRATNNGRLLLETVSNDGFDRGCYLTIAAGGMLENTTNGIIECQPGQGDGRLITGSLRNRGQIIVGPNETADFHGQLEAAGGTYSGLFYVSSADVTPTAVPRAPTTLLLVGGSNRLLADNPVDLTLWLRGSTLHGWSILTLPNGVTNRGTLLLENFSNDGFDRGSYININTGTLVNASSGTIRVNAGNGDPRGITGNLDNSGTIFVQSNINLTINGANHQFWQRGGLVQADGEMLSQGGTFDFSGGALLGVVRAQSAFVTVADTVTSTSTLRTVSDGGILGGNLSPSVTLWQEGSISYGYSLLNVTNPVVNRGRILQQTISNDGFDRGCYLRMLDAGRLENDTTGVIECQLGAGDGRLITGPLKHRGQIIVGPNETAEYRGALEEAGGTFDGELYVRNTDLSVTAPPVQPTTLLLLSDQNRLLTDNAEGLTLYLQGRTDYGWSILSLPNGATNRGTIRMETISNDGFDRGCYVNLGAGPLVNATNGVVQVNLGAGDPRRIAGVFTNQGLVILSNATLDIAAGPFVNDITGVIAGPGGINAGGINFQNNGTISPGASPGLISFTGNYVQGASGQFNVEIAGTNVASQYDRLAISGSATLGGKLNVTILDDFLPAVSNVFRVMTHASVTGQFSELNGLNIFTNRSLLPSYSASGFDLIAIEATNVIVTKPSILTQPASQTIINGQTATFHVTANGTRPFEYQWLFHGTNLSGATGDSLVLVNAQTNQSGPYQVIITNSAGSVTSLVAILTVRPVADLVIGDVNGPTNSPAGQPLQLTWLTRNQGSQSALAPWLESVSLATNSTATGTLIPVTSFLITNSLAAGQSFVRTQTVIPPGGLDGWFYFVVTADAANQVPEEANETNNLTVATNLIRLRSPDLQPRDLLLSGSSAQFGQGITVSWLSTNSGSTAALLGWNDRVYLGTNNNNLSGATLLATLTVTNVPLADGSALSNSLDVVLPLTPQSQSGNYFVLVSEDHGNLIAESAETNNLIAAPLTLTLPPLPDLAVTNVIGPTNASPGQLIEVSWTTTNRGNLSVNGAWTETVFLATNSTGEGLIELASFAYSNALPVGGSLAHTEHITIPVTCPVGESWLAVQADSREDVVEQSDLNNVGVAASATAIPAVLTLQANPLFISEGAAQPVLFTVTRNGPRTSGLNVTITNSDSTELSAPAEIVIPAGQASANFNATALTDGIVDGAQIVTLGVSAAGFAAANRQVTVSDVDVPHLTISLVTNTVLEGSIFTATILRDGPVNQPVTVSVNGSLPAQLAAPQPVTIPAGQSSAPINLIAIDDPLIEAPAVYTLVATAEGYLPGAADVTVIDNDLPAVSLTFMPATVSENGGHQATIATLTRNLVSARALELELESGNTNVVRLPPRVSIPAGEASFNLPVTVVDNSIVDGTKNVLVRVWIRGTESGERIGEGTPAILTVTDDDGPTLTLALDRALVAEGLNPAANATVSRNTGTNGALVVDLASGNTSEIAIPPTVVIPDGASSVNFTLASINDGLTDGNKLVTLTAAANSYTTGQAQITVSDVNLPDLVVSDLTAPATAETEAFANLGYFLRNQGLTAMASNAVIQRIYLSPDAFVGDDTLMGQFTYNGSLPAGDQIGQTFQLRMPVAAGDYWVVVETDVNNAVPEILEDNNKRISSQPIHVSAAYAATVSTPLDTAPANTPVPMTGHAFKPSTGGPAPFALVNLHLKVRGTHRIIAALADANGDFSTTWQPLPGEAGFYEIAAAHPGDPDPATQDTFTLFGMKATPASVALSLTEQSATGGVVVIANAGELPLTGLSSQILNLPANLNFTATLQTNFLGGLASNYLTYAVTALNASVPQAQLTVRLTSAEGATLDVPFNVNVAALLPRLVVAPSELNSGMKRGAQTLVNFSVANLGGATSGPVTISLPSLPWMSLVTPSPLPPLEPGQTNTVTLQLMPPADLPLTTYVGNLLLSSVNSQVSVPFSFRALSEAKGDLRVVSVDEFTYFAEGTPRLTNAAVTLKDSLSGKPVTSGVTDTNGEFFVAQLPEGYYDLELTADAHASYKATHLLLAGVTNDITAFLSRQTVRYTWTVVPTEIQDHYRISVETVFEANVPAPVITVDPPVIEVGDLTTEGQVKQINMTIRNQGLIAVNDVHLGFTDHPAFQIEPLIGDLGQLGARSSLTIPVTVRRIKVFARPGVAGRDAGGVCGMSGQATFNFICGPLKVGGSAPIAVSGIHGDCPGGAAFVPIGGGGGGSASGGGVSIGIKIVCDPRCLILAGLGCIPGPIGCFFSGWSCGESIRDNPAGVAAADCIIGAAGCLIPGAGLPACMYSIARCFINPARPVDGLARPDGLAKSTTDLIDEFEPGVRAMLDAFNQLTGAPDGVWINPQANSDTGDWYARFQSAANPASDGGRPITSAERADLLTGVQPPGVATAEVNRVIDRWNRSIANWEAGIFTHAQAPSGANLDFMDYDNYKQAMIAVADYQKLAEAAGFTDPINAIVETARFRDTQGDSGGTCARVRLRIDQDAVISREAFHATLEFDNNGGSTLSDIRVIVRATDGNGLDATSLFGIAPPTVSGISDVAGSGLVTAGGHASANWTIIPTVDAAPDAPVQYFVSGELRYTLDGVAVTVPLAPVGITVHPTPRLKLDYFLERDVFADDPHTDAVEPSQPFSLAVLVQNRGAGVAKNFRITSAQPEIVDNEKGLLVDFKIIATEVAGKNLVPSLTADFGDVGANATAVARWLMTSTLQGLFIDYDATFEHVDGLGNPRLSLIDDVAIHEMNHLVQATGAFEDGKLDFLVNEVPDLRDYPDTLFLSDGRTFPVEVITNGTAGTPSSGNLQVQLTAALPGGWAYLRLPDPANGQYQLVSIQRSDSGVINSNNFWITDRTFLGQGRRPTRENVLHLLDYNSTSTYTLTYEINPALDTTPPSSSVAALPANSKANIPINWSGQDTPGGGGIAFYDVYVSEDGGAFQRWLNGTLDTAAIYQGNLGRSYAFYSVAVDRAGNRETAPATPDAQTMVTLTNHAPSLLNLSNVTIVEGDTLSLVLNATDPDDDELTFSLLPGSPNGVVVNAFSGLLTWVTGEGNGPTTNTITVQVLDNGAPRLGMFGSFNVVVLENNTPPVLAGITNRTISEGQLLTFAAFAQDFDLPPQTLTYRLGPGAPEGASINTNTGVFTWRPGDAQGGTTNVISIIVSDNGQPSGSATQSFNVIVRDTRPDLVLGIGSTALLSGDSGAVPLALHSGVDVTNLQLTLAISGDRIANVNLQSLASEVASVDFTPLGSNRYSARFRSRSDAVLQGDLALAQLAFHTVSNEHSAVAFIGGESLVGHRTSTATPLPGNVQSGRVFIIGREPILDSTAVTNQQLALTLYARPGERYAIERRSPLTGTNDWSFDSMISQNSLWSDLPLRAANAASEFFRALLIPGSELQIRLVGDQVVIEWPQDCAACELEESGRVGLGAIWTRSSAQPQLVNGRYRVSIPINSSPRFYRLAVQPR